MNPANDLRKKLSPYSNIELQSNPSDEKMRSLIEGAQIHCLYTSQPTGLKLKLLNTLFTGRFVICNENMVYGTGLSENSGLYITNDFIKAIDDVFESDFNDEMIEQRSIMLSSFNNERNADLIIKSIWND